MENKQAGVLRLCMILFVFGMSIIFVNNNKKKFLTATHIDILNIKAESVSNIPLDTAFEQIHLLAAAHDIDLIVKLLGQCTYAIACNLIEKAIINDNNSLSQEDKIKIIFGLTAHYNHKKNAQYELLDFVLKYPSLYKNTPLLLTLARSKYADMIATFIVWGKDRQKSIGKPQLLASFAESAFNTAVKQNDYVAMETMFSKKLRISQEYATALLSYVVNNNKDSALVRLLVHHAHADVNYAERGKTLLITAVERNNIDMMRVLLDEGAVVDRVIDTRKGSALTIALKNKYTQAAELLREYGAA